MVGIQRPALIRNACWDEEDADIASKPFRA
jgi:hypothetical protein